MSRLRHLSRLQTTVLIVLGGVLFAWIAISLMPGARASAQLVALKRDPMATYVPRSSELVDSSEQSEGTDRLMGKPHAAKFRRSFLLRSRDPVAGLDQIVLDAEKHGWNFDNAEPFELLGHVVRAGTKRLVTGEARISISIAGAGARQLGNEPVPGVSIALEHASG